MTDQPSADTARTEWQVAVGSPTAHVIDLDAPQWKNPDGSRRRNGPRSLCGRYPQRNADGIWWALSVAETRPETGRGFRIRYCEDCTERLSRPADTHVATKSSGEVVDLLAALQRSVDAAKADRVTRPGGES